MKSLNFNENRKKNLGKELNDMKHFGLILVALNFCSNDSRQFVIKSELAKEIPIPKLVSLVLYITKLENTVDPLINGHKKSGKPLISGHFPNDQLFAFEPFELQNVENLSIAEKSWVNKHSTKVGFYFALI